MNTDLRGKTLGTYLLDWLAPALFALLVSATIRYHSLTPGPTMSRTIRNLLLLASVVLLGLLALGRRFSVPRDIALLLLALAASATVSVLGSGGADVSLLRLKLYLTMAMVAMALYLTYRDVGRLPLESYFFAISLVHLPFLLAAVLWVRDLAQPFWQDGIRLADFAHVRQFGEFAFFAAASATALGVLSRRLAIASFLLAGAALFGIILTGCRGALLSWILFVLLLCCFSRARVRAGLHGLGVVLLAAALVWYLDRSGLLPSPNIFGRVAELGQNKASDFDSGRIALWAGSIRQIMVHPLFGSGPEGYWLSGCCDRTIMQAHDFILQFLMEFGLVGCAILLLVLLRVSKRLGGVAGLQRLMAGTPGNRVLGCLLAAYLAYGLIDQMLYHLLPLLLFALFAGLFAAGLAQARAAARAPA